MKKIFFVLIILIAGLLLFSGCTQEKKENAADENKTKTIPAFSLTYEKSSEQTGLIVQRLIDNNQMIELIKENKKSELEIKQNKLNQENQNKLVALIEPLLAFKEQISCSNCGLPEEKIVLQVNGKSNEIVFNEGYQVPVKLNSLLLKIDELKENLIANENILNECKTDFDCAKVDASCCGCNEGGKATAISKTFLNYWQLNQQINCKGQMCAQVMSSDKSCVQEQKCTNNLCGLQ